jgi:hypothetical protein
MGIWIFLSIFVAIILQLLSLQLLIIVHDYSSKNDTKPLYSNITISSLNTTSYSNMTTSSSDTTLPSNITSSSSSNTMLDSASTIISKCSFNETTHSLTVDTMTNRLLEMIICEPHEVIRVMDDDHFKVDFYQPISDRAHIWKDFGPICIAERHLINKTIVFMPIHYGINSFENSSFGYRFSSDILKCMNFDLSILVRHGGLKYTTTYSGNILGNYLSYQKISTEGNVIANYHPVFFIDMCS